MIDINQQKKGKQMPSVSARPAQIDDLPAIVDLRADDILGQSRETCK